MRTEAQSVAEPRLQREISELARYGAELGMPYQCARHEFDRAWIVAALKSCDWNQCRAARQLEMHRNTLAARMRELGIAGRRGRVS